MVEVRVLGELEIAQGGAIVALPASRKTRALLGYLVVTGRPQLRERLCELFWDGPDDPRAALRWSLHKLRPLVDDTAQRLQADREHVGFVAAGAAVDLVRARALGDPATASLDALRAAAALFRGDLLDGIELRDCLRFHEWLVAERESARALRLAILCSLTERLSSEPEEALRWSRERLILEPLDEAAHLQVARALADLGRTREALAQLENFRTRLTAELNATPSPELDRLRRALLTNPQSQNQNQIQNQIQIQNQNQNQIQIPTPHQNPSPSRLPLVGRAPDVALLSTLLASPTPPVVLLDGEPGIGKTRLLAELADRARADGRTVLAGRAYQAETVRPYGAWIDALRSAPLPALPDHRRADLALLLPELGPASGADRGRLFDAVGATIAAHAPPAVVILDDVQWLDEVSAALLHYLTRSAGPTLFALAARSGEVEDNPAFLRAGRHLGREGRLLRHALGRLSAEDTAELARRVAPSLDPASVYAESAGNPLFAIEVARAGGCAEGLPPTLDAIIADRLGELEPPLLEVVGLAAAIGHSFSVDELARASTTAAAVLLDAVEELERRAILCAAGDRFDFSHDLVRRGAYRRLSPARRRHVHLAIARGLASETVTDGTLAHHAALAGDHELAARACVDAGDRALRVFANAEAIALAERGRRHLAEIAEPTRNRLQVELARVEITAHLSGSVLPGARGRHRAAGALRAELHRTIAAAETLGLVVETRRAFRLLGQLEFDEGDPATSLAYLQRSAADDSAAADLAMNGRCLAQLEGDLGTARRHLAAAGASPAGAELGELHWGLGLLARWEGDHATARSFLERALATFRRELDRWRECTCLTGLAMIDLEDGDAGRFGRRVAELLPLAARLGDGAELPFAQALAALAACLAREPDAAARLEDAIGALRLVDSKGQLAYILDVAAALDLENGRIDAARDRAAEALGCAETIGRRSETALARAVLAQAAASAGARDEALRALEPALPQLGVPDRLPLRARAALTSAASALGLAVPTPAPTPASTRAR